MSEKRRRLECLRIAASIPAVRDDGLSTLLSCADRLYGWLMNLPADTFIESKDALKRSDKRTSGTGRDAQVCSGPNLRTNLITLGGKVYKLSDSNIHDPVSTLTLTYKAVHKDDGRASRSDFVNSCGNHGEQSIGSYFTHKDSSSVAGEESGDSAATDPRNDATPSGGARHV